MLTEWLHSHPFPDGGSYIVANLTSYFVPSVGQAATLEVMGASWVLANVFFTIEPLFSLDIRDVDILYT